MQPVRTTSIVEIRQRSTADPVLAHGLKLLSKRESCQSIGNVISICKAFLTSARKHCKVEMDRNAEDSTFCLPVKTSKLKKPQDHLKTVTTMNTISMGNYEYFDYCCS